MVRTGTPEGYDGTDGAAEQGGTVGMASHPLQRVPSPEGARLQLAGDGAALCQPRDADLQAVHERVSLLSK